MTALHGKGLWEIGITSEVSDLWLNAGPVGWLDGCYWILAVSRSRQGQKGRSKGIKHGSLSHCLSLSLSLTFCFPLATETINDSHNTKHTFVCVSIDVFSFTLH